MFEWTKVLGEAGMKEIKSTRGRVNLSKKDNLFIRYNGGRMTRKCFEVQNGVEEELKMGGLHYLSTAVDYYFLLKG